MGQEKSLPIRCNSCHNHNYSSSIKITTSSPSTTSSTSSGNLKTTSKHHTTHHHKLAPSPVRSPSRSTTKSIKSTQSSTTTLNTTRTRSSSHCSTTSTYKSIDNQTKYLNQQLFIKSYSDIVEEDRTTKAQFKPARNGIRNYTPKILVEQTTPASSTSTSSTSSTSSNDHEDIDIWI